MELLVVSVVGMVVFGGLFLVLCPEWWSTSMGTLKEKKAKEKQQATGEAQGPKANP
jgi:hypothetical protein